MGSDSAVLASVDSSFDHCGRQTGIIFYFGKTTNLSVSCFLWKYFLQKKLPLWKLLTVCSRVTVVSQSVHHFDLNISTIGWIAIKFCKDIHVPQRMKHPNFDDPLTFPYCHQQGDILFFSEITSVGCLNVVCQILFVVMKVIHVPQ